MPPRATGSRRRRQLAITISMAAAWPDGGKITFTEPTVRPCRHCGRTIYRVSPLYEGGASWVHDEDGAIECADRKHDAEPAT